MAQCEMCGKLANLVVVDVEGSDLNVCSSCTSYGKVKKKIFLAPSLRQQLSASNKPEYKVVAHYSSLLRNVREANNMSHKAFSEMLNEREAIISKWESGSVKPSVDNARKLERILGIKLVQEDIQANSSENIKTSKVSDELTLGDFIKVRKRK